MSDNENNNGIVDLQAEARRRQKEREAQEAAEAAKAASQPDPERVYEVVMKNGTVLQVPGVLMLTGAFFALGEPIGDGGAVDFNWAAPVDAVDFVVALDDEDLNDE